MPPESSSNPIASVSEGGKKLPKWQIVLVVAGGAAVVYYIWKKNQSSSSSPQYLPATTGGANPAEYSGGTSGSGSNNEGLTSIMGILQQQTKEQTEARKEELRQRGEEAKAEKEQRTEEGKKREEREGTERTERREGEKEERELHAHEATHLEELIKGITNTENETLKEILGGLKSPAQVPTTNENPGYYYNPAAAPNPTPSPSGQVENPPQPSPEQVITQTGNQVNQAGGFGTGLKDLFGERFIVNPSGPDSYILAKNGEKYPNTEWNRGHPKQMRK